MYASSCGDTLQPNVDDIIISEAVTRSIHVKVARTRDAFGFAATTECAPIDA
jgi:hypothetical protein